MSQTPTLQNIVQEIKPISKDENRNSRFAFWIEPAYYFRGSIPDAKTPNHGGSDSNAFAVHDAHKSLAFPTQNFAQQRSR
jgi:hypothetical protein